MTDLLQSIGILVLALAVIVQGFTIHLHTKAISSVRADLTTQKTPGERAILKAVRVALTAESTGEVDRNGTA